MTLLMKKLAVVLIVLIGITLQAQAKNAMHIVINNHLGAPEMLIDENQHVVWQAEYDEFGKATLLVEQVEFNHRFPGQYYDKETGLSYNYYRDYDPSLGRYVQSDPIGQLYDFSDPQMQVAMRMGMPLQSSPSGIGLNHLYAYVSGNPISFTDPFGLYGTSSCAYYSQACNTTGDFYACNIAAKVCPVFPEGEKDGWFQCVRLCLQEEHARREESATSCPVKDNPVTDHTTCFTACGTFHN